MGAGRRPPGDRGWGISRYGDPRRRTGWNGHPCGLAPGRRREGLVADLVARRHAHRVRALRRPVRHLDRRPPDGRGATDRSGFCLEPRLGPAGGLIAADTTQEFPSDVLILKEDGTLVRRVSRQGFSFETGVSWSPDGSRLAIGGGLVLDRNGDAAGSYASGSRYDFVVRSPEWSPDGATVVYLRAPVHEFPRTNTRYLGPADLYSSPSQGGAESRLTRTPNLDEGDPDFRPAAGTKPARAAPCVLSGTSGGDVIRGTASSDLIDAGRGADVVYGGGGNDLLAGGPGNDRLLGDPGATSSTVATAATGSMRGIGSPTRSMEAMDSTARGSIGPGDFTRGVEIRYRRR